MSLLQRFKASPHNLRGPNFTSSEELKLNLSGTVVRYKNPPLTCMIPYVTPVTELDINQPGSLLEPTHNYEIAKARNLCENGWNFYSNFFNENAVGGMLADLALLEPIEARNNQNSLFKKQQCINWIIEEEHAINQHKNQERKEQHEKNRKTGRLELIEYPHMPSDLQEHSYNGHTWFKYTIKDHYSETITFRTAIGENHLLTLTFQPDSYKGVDYHSTAHNLPESVDRAIEELMQSMHITLSPQAQKKYDEANKV